jgi:transposase InsO family protein
LVVLLLRNNKSTRYAAFFQPASNTRFSYSSGKAESHDYQLYLAINDIEHTRTKVRHPQTNGICERFHKTIPQEFYQPALRRKVYASIEELQTDLDEWLEYYINERAHQGKMCCGRTPMDTLLDGKRIWKEKFVN